jgi:hypothetical protein
MAQATVAPDAGGGRSAPPRKQVRLFMHTERKDAWWFAPLITFLGLSTFIGYATWAALQGKNYFYGGGGADYLSPFYSPQLFGTEGHPLIRASLGLPGLITPAMIILPIPVGFRFTCYYYRGAYYKAFWGDPPNCAVGEPRKSYWGERKFPLILQNVHRYFMYLAVIFIFLLAWDVEKAMWFNGKFGIGVGTLVLALNVVLLGGYTFGCHSLRHVVGGGRDKLPSGGVGKSCYDCVSGLNRKHMLFAWCSLVWVGFSDFYVRMCAMGVFKDFRII